jgi:hypothetical protein
MRLRTLILTPTLFHGMALAAAVGLLGGLAMKVGSQAESVPDAGFVQGSQYVDAAPIAWPAGKTPDYVIGTDFLAQTEPVTPPPSEEIAYHGDDDAPIAWRPEPPPPVTTAWVAPSAAPPEPELNARRWASTGGDILDRRLPEDLGDGPVDPPVEPPVEPPAEITDPG